MAAEEDSDDEVAAMSEVFSPTNVKLNVQKTPKQSGKGKGVKTTTSNSTNAGKKGKTLTVTANKDRKLKGQ